MSTQQRKALEKDHRRRTILEAAESLMQESGLYGLNIDLVAARTELAKGTIYGGPGKSAQRFRGGLAHAGHGTAHPAITGPIDPEELEKTRKRMQLAARIADGINAKGWNKKQFAEKMKVAPSVVSRWLSGTHNFESDTLFNIEVVPGIGIILLETT